MKAIARRAVIAMGLFLVWGGAEAAQSEIDYMLPGPYATARIDQNLRDATRGRDLQLSTLYPSEDGVTLAPKAAPCPLIVFSHGFLLRGGDYLAYAEHFASYGFIVGLPTYEESLLNVDHAALADDLRWVIDLYLRASSAGFGPVAGAIDSARIGVAGHSLGGKISLLAATKDARIRAAGLLDPVDSAPFGGHDESAVRFPSVTPERMPALHIPLLLIGSEFGGEVVIYRACAPIEDNYQRYYEAANPPAIEITQLGAGHLQYVDRGVSELFEVVCAPGTADGRWIRRSAMAYLTAFFRQALNVDPSAQNWLDARLQKDQDRERIVVRRKEPEETGTPSMPEGDG